MEIIMSDYPFGYPQDLKWAMVEKGFEMIGAEQLNIRKVRMIFARKV